MRYFLFILLAGLFSACSADDDSNAAATAAKLEVSKNEVKLSNGERLVHHQHNGYL